MYEVLLGISLAVFAGVWYLVKFLFNLHADRNQAKVDLLELKKSVLKQSEQAILFSNSINANLQNAILRILGKQSGGKDE
jgi:hypothetical protein